MLIKGTRILQGKDAFQYSEACENFRKFMISQGFLEIILPNLAYQEIFTKKALDQGES